MDLILLAITAHGHLGKVIHHVLRHHAAAPVVGFRDILVPFTITLAVMAGLAALINYAIVRAIRRSQLRGEQRVIDQQAVQARRAAIERGGLAQIYPTGVMPIAGEKFIYEQQAQWGQTHTHRQTSGASPAIYIPLGHGIRGRIGGYKGTSQIVSNFQWGPHGTVYVSNLRIAFKADGQTELGQIPYEKISAYDLFPDGISLAVTGLGTVQIRTGDDCLGILFKQIVTSQQVEAGGAEIKPSAFNS